MIVYVEAYARDAVAANALRMSAPQTNRFRFPTAIPFFVVCSSFDCLDFVSSACFIARSNVETLRLMCANVNGTLVLDGTFARVL